MTKHTPGPWHASEKMPFYVKDSNGNHIADCQTAHFPKDVYDANGYLIAAAPEMLEALLSIEDHFLSMGEDDWACFKEVENAIKKATGET